MNNKLSIFTAPFKSDKILWVSFVSILALHVYACGYSFMLSTAIIASALTISVLVAHIPPRYYKVVAPILYSVTLLLMLLTFVMSDSQYNLWMSIGTITVNPRWFAGLTTVLISSLLLTNEHVPAVRRHVYAVVAVALYLNTLAIMDVIRALCIAIAISTALFICNMARRKLCEGIIGLGVVFVLLFGGVVLFGKTSSEKSEEHITERTVILKRVDNWKERITDIQSEKQQSISPIGNNDEDKNREDSILLVASLLLFSGFVAFRATVKLKHHNSQYVRFTGVACACMLFTDTICFLYVPYACNTAEYSLVITSCMFGTVISCIGSSNKYENQSSVLLYQQSSLKDILKQLLED